LLILLVGCDVMAIAGGPEHGLCCALVGRCGLGWVAVRATDGHGSTRIRRSWWRFRGGFLPHTFVGFSGEFR
jgi:hypothetical protein